MTNMHNEFICDGISRILAYKVRFAMMFRMPRSKDKNDTGYFNHSRFRCSLSDSDTVNFGWDAIWVPSFAHEYTQRKLFIELKVTGLDIRGTSLNNCIDGVAMHLASTQRSMLDEMKSNGERESTTFNEISIDELRENQ